MIVTPALLLFADALVEVPPALSSFLLTRFNAPGTDLAVRCIVLFCLASRENEQVDLNFCEFAREREPAGPKL